MDRPRVNHVISRMVLVEKCDSSTQKMLNLAAASAIFRPRSVLNFSLVSPEGARRSNGLPGFL